MITIELATDPDEGVVLRGPLEELGAIAERLKREGALVRAIPGPAITTEERVLLEGPRQLRVIDTFDALSDALETFATRGPPGAWPWDLLGAWQRAKRHAEEQDG